MGNVSGFAAGCWVGDEGDVIGDRVELGDKISMVCYQEVNADGGNRLTSRIFSSIICWISVAFAARTHVRLLEYVPGQPSDAVRLYHAGA